jgi:hypothetical protein
VNAAGLVELVPYNLLSYSERFENAYWNKNGGSISANSSTAPNGTTTADRLTLAATTATHGLIDFGVSGVATSTYTVSFFVKKGTHRYITIGIYRNTLNNAGAGFDLDTNTITGTGATGAGYSASGATITDAGNGWYRCSVVCVSGTTPMTGSGFFLRNTSYTSGAIQESWAAAGTETINLWGAQLEAGAYPTSYIPTTSASVTRNADVISKTGISSLIGQTEGTMFAEFDNLLQTSYGSEYLISLYGDASNQIWIRKESGTNTYTARVLASGSTAVTFLNIPVLNGQNKIALAYKSGQSVVYLNGALIATDTDAFTIGTSISQLGLANLNNTVVGYEKIKSAALWKERLSNDELTALTTI